MHSKQSAKIYITLKKEEEKKDSQSRALDLINRSHVWFFFFFFFFFLVGGGGGGGSTHVAKLKKKKDEKKKKKKKKHIKNYKQKY